MTVIPALLALITFVVFLPTLQNGFVNWDDDSHLLDNPHYRGLGWAQLRWMFTTCLNGSCMPLNWVTYGLDYVLWGMNPAGYHFTSLLIHACNAAIFYFLCLRLLRLGLADPDPSPSIPIRIAALFSALFFAIHPLQVEVVAWTIGREMAIAGFFFILTLLCYLQAAESASFGLPRGKWMLASYIFYAMSLLGKEAALTLPFALVILDVYPLKRLGPGFDKWFGKNAYPVWREKVPFLLLAVAAGVRATLEKQEAGSIYSMALYGFLPRLNQVLYSLTFYPSKTLVPIDLSPLYPLHPFTGIWTSPLLLNGAIILCLSVGLFLARHRWPAALAAWIFYVILLVPVSGIVAFGPYRAADRFGYLPSLVWAVLAGVPIYYCWRLWLTHRLRLTTLITSQAFVVLLLLALAALTRDQVRIWHNSETLWRHALATEDKSSIAHNNLGLVLAERGRLDEAVKEFRRALEIDPAFVEAHTNLGNFLAQQGSSHEAIAHLQHALKIEPSFASAHNALGNILADRGELGEAVGHFQSALKNNPESAITHYNLARTLAKRGDIVTAIAHYRRALEINPKDADVHNNLGLLLVSQGSVEAAAEHFRQALRIDFNYARAHFNLGKVNAQQGRLDDAVANFHQALRLQPAEPDIHENLARVLARQGRSAEALQAYREALRLLQSRAQQTAAR